MKIFVSGPMTGIPDYNFPKFEEVEERLKVQGHDVMSMRIIVMTEFKGDLNRTHAEYMQAALKYLPLSTHLCLLNGWERSDGTKCEVAVALTLGMRFVNENGKEVYPPESVTIRWRRA